MFSFACCSWKNNNTSVAIVLRRVAFEWDAAKARGNVAKHGISFRLTTSVLRDPLALTIFDEEHSDFEERWLTLGQASNGQYLVVIHTFQHIRLTDAIVRIISARKAERDEINDYLTAPR